MNPSIKVFAILLAVGLAGCSKHSTSPSSPSHPATPILSITGFSPNNGPDSTKVTITGTAFDATGVKDSVFFNGRAARIVSTTDSTIVAIVPELAGTGDITVKVDANTVTGSTFAYDTSYKVSTIAAGLSGPFYVAIDTMGSLYVSLYGEQRILKIDSTGSTSTFANFYATGLAIDNRNNLFAVFNSSTQPQLLKLGPSGDTTIIGNIPLGFTLGLAVDASDNLYFCNASTNTVQRMTPQGVVTTLASGLFSPSGVGVGPDGTIYATNYSVAAYDDFAGALTAISPGGAVSTNSTMDYDGNAAILVDANNDIYITVEDSQTAVGWIEKIPPGGTPMVLPSAPLSFPCGIVRDKKANLFVVQQVDSPGGSTGSVVKMTPY